jgi:hypothetical protein
MQSIPVTQYRLLTLHDLVQNGSDIRCFISWNVFP